jgi:hypothetical protein
MNKDKEYQQQLKNSVIKNLGDFNNNPKFLPLRIFYKQNFDLIKR